ncbi:nucleotide exchange factor GrpE [Streptomyces sp. NPDC088726]|uniref:nucleotide exchange factor GrpE n=1 Tax=Streptomyces sp. NPDC088726 TaxID=3365874 RepID=UPI003828BE1E
MSTPPVPPYTPHQAGQPQQAEPSEQPEPPEPSEQPVPADPFAVVADAVDGMREELASLGDQFRRRLLNDREARRSLDELHAALGHTREHAEGRTLQPLLYDLILLTDRVERQSGDDTQFADSVTAELRTLLEKYGMTRVPVTPGPFDPAAQEAVGTVAAVSPERVGEIAEVVRHGYRMGERVIRPQQVRVYTAP